MAGLLDLFGGAATQPGALYGGLLTPQQNSALGYRGLLAAAGALGQAAMPSRLPIPIGAALGQAAGAMGSAQDEAALNAMRGQLVGLQGQSLASDLAIRKQLAGLLPGLAGGAGVPGASPLTGASPAGGGEVGSPAPNASVNDNSGIEAGQLYGFLAQNGATPNEAAMLTSAANSESSFRPDITHDGGIGYGLFGHNTDRLAAMREFAGVGPNDPVPWQKQALFALSELHGSESKAGAMVNSATTPEQLTDAQLAFERPNLNIAGGNRAQRLASTREYMASPPGARPTQLAQANTGTATDAIPDMHSYAPMPLAPQSLLPNPSVAPQAPGGNGLAVGPGANVPRGLLASPSLPSPAVAPLQQANAGTQPTATPFTNAPPINGVGAPAPGPQGGLLAPQAPQVAQAAPRAPMVPGAPGMGIGLPSVPNIDPRSLAAASSLAQLGHMGDVFGPLEKYYYQSPGYLAQAEGAKTLAGVPAHNLESQFNTNEAIRKEISIPFSLRQGESRFGPSGNIIAQSPRLPEGTQAVPGPNGEIEAKPVPGAFPAIQASAAAEETGKAQGATLQQRNEVLKQEYEKNVVEPFNHAQVAIAPLTALQNAMAGFQTGPTAETKLNLLRAWQAFGKYAGVPPDSELADQISSGEIIKKEGTQLGFALARTLGSREAGQIVQQAIQTNPGLQNSPQGNTQLIGLIRQGLQRDIDKRAFYDNWFNKNLSYDGAGVAFNNAAPVEKYVSQILPFQPKTPAEAMQLPRGTRFVDPAGTIRTSPGPQQ